MKLEIKKGSIDQTLIIFISDSSSTTGAGLTGLVYNTASLVCYYARPLAVAAALTLATQTVTGAHSDGGFVEIDSTNMPGIYRLDLSDTIIASGVDSVVLMLKGAANMADLPIEIQLVDNVEKDTYDIANHASYGNAKLVRSTTPANTLDIAATGEAGIDWGNIGNPTTVVDLSGTDIQLCDTVTTLTGHTVQTGDGYAIVNHASYGNAQLIRTVSAPSNWNNFSLTASGRVTVGTTQDKTGFSLAADQSGVTIGTVNAFGTQAKTDINNEVVDGLQTDTITEPSDLITDKSLFGLAWHIYHAVCTAAQVDKLADPEVLTHYKINGTSAVKNWNLTDTVSFAKRV